MEYDSRQHAVPARIMSHSTAARPKLHILPAGRKARSNHAFNDETCLREASENKNLVSLTRILRIRSLRSDA
jgi:hypothetical protein